MMKKYKIFPAIFAVFAAQIVLAAENTPSIRSYADKNRILIGDRIRYTIEVGSRKELDVQFERFKDNRIGDFEIKDTGAAVKKGWFGGKKYLHWYNITAYSAGKHPIAPVNVKYRLKGVRDWAGLTTKALVINVDSLLPKEGAAKDIRDIKGPITLHETNWFLISAIAGGIFLIALVVLTCLKLAGRSAPLAPHERAFKALEAAKDMLSKTGDIKEYYANVSNCIREYIELTFNLKAPEMTTEEFLSSLEKSRFLSLEYKGPLKDFLEACDMVKFAKYAPTKDETESVFAAARHFVEETKSSSLAAEAKEIC